MVGEAVLVVQLMLLAVTVLIAVFALPEVVQEEGEVGVLREVLLKTTQTQLQSPPVPEANASTSMATRSHGQQPETATVLFLEHHPPQVIYFFLLLLDCLDEERHNLVVLNGQVVLARNAALFGICVKGCKLDGLR